MALVSVSSKVYDGSRRFDIIKVFNDGQTAATGTSIDSREIRGINLVVETGAGVSAGVVTLEGAVSSDYSGTWVSLGAITTNAALTAFKEGHDNLAESFPYVRARISTGLTGGTADVYVMLIK